MLLRARQICTINRDIRDTAHRIGEFERHWRSTAEAYGNTAQLSKRVRDVLAVAGVAQTVNRGLENVGKTPIYYALAALVADRVPDLVGAERQQAIYLLAADAASCLYHASARTALTQDAICARELMADNVLSALQDYRCKTEDLVRHIYQKGRGCRGGETPDPLCPEAICPGDSGEHLRRITQTPAKKKAPSCGKDGASYWAQYESLASRARGALGAYEKSVAAQAEIPHEFSRRIERLAYAVNGDLAKGDVGNYSGFQLAAELKQAAGLAQSGNEREMPERESFWYGERSIALAHARTVLEDALARLNAENQRIVIALKTAEDEAGVCEGSRNLRIRLSPPVSLITLTGASPSYVISAEDEQGAPDFRLSGAGAFETEKVQSGNTLRLTVKVDKTKTAAGAALDAQLQFVSHDGKRFSDPVKIEYRGSK